MSEDDKATPMLNFGARKLVELALQKFQESGAPYLGVYHWLMALLDRHGSMAESMVSGFQMEAVKKSVTQKLAQGDAGKALPEAEVGRLAQERARQRDRLQASERDVAVVILSSAGFAIIPGFEMQIQRSEKGAPETMDENPVGKVMKTATPALDQFGRDLTQAVREGKIGPVIGREDELSLVVETLCRRTKRNPVLVGPAGVGKTAIVEGLARRVVAGNVPTLLKGARIIALQPSILVAGASVSGELEKRMKAVLLEARQEGIVLFIDEIHTVIGSGGMMGTSDIGSMLKPALARGDIACIAATTDDEYRRYIENDAALERRFQPIRVNEPTADQTLEVLKAIRDDLNRSSQVTIPDEVLQWQIDFCMQYMRNRFFPDKAVDLLEQSYAHAVALGKNCVEMADAQDVAQRMVGMPLVSADRLNMLRKDLSDRRLLTSEEINILINRLQVTMRGLDMRASRPNAILLLTGEAIENSQSLSETISNTLFGSTDRIISIDFSRFNEPEDINMLIGAPPGYVGYNDRLPLHRVAQIPWCVLRFERVDACHPRIREVLAQSFSDGWIMDGRGKNLYLSDVIVVLTADVSFESHRGLGFRPEENHLTAEEVFQSVVARIGDNLAEQVDLFSFGRISTEGVSPEWLQNNFLADIYHRYLKQGVKLTWDPSFLNWMVQQQGSRYSEREWENWVDSYLTPSIIPYIPPSGWKNAIEVVVGYAEESIQVVPGKTED